MTALTSSFLTLSSRVQPQAHLSILISAEWSCLSWFLQMGQHSLPYSIVGLTTALYTLPLSVLEHRRSHRMPVDSLHFIQAALIRAFTAWSTLPSAARLLPRYWKSSTLSMRSLGSL